MDLATEGDGQKHANELRKHRDLSKLDTGGCLTLDAEGRVTEIWYNLTRIDSLYFSGVSFLFYDHQPNDGHYLFWIVLQIE